MKLLIITALIAVCGAAKLDRTYLPPPSANTAGGSQDSLQTPLIKSSSGQGEISSDLPSGSYTNNFQGVVVDAAAAGVRASSDGDQSGLGGPRDTYGSTNSKVGDAAFRGSVAGFRNTQTVGSSALNGQGAEINAGQNFGAFDSKSERPQAHKDRNSNIISYANDVSSDNYSYGFESDNGIAVGENGVASNGIQAQGGYSYKGDDGQVYKVTYVADEGGYRPQGAHLPTPPPIPKEILESLEQNAKEEAAGIVDDGSYDAQKYNAEGDYTYHNSGNNQYNGAQLSQFSKRPESDATASSTFINQNNQAFGKPGQLGNTTPNFNGQFNQFGVANTFGSKVPSTNNGLTQSQFNKQPTQTLSGHQQSSTTGFHNSGHYGQNPGTQSTSQYQSSVGSQSSQFGAQSNQQVPSTQSTQLGSQVNQQPLDNQFEPQSSQIGYTQGSATQFGGQSSQVGSAQGNQVGPANQIGTENTKPSFGQIHSAPSNYQSNQGTQFGNHEYKPQNSFGTFPQAQNSLGKPQYNSNNQGHSQVSQSQYNTQGSNRPSFGSFESNKPSNIGQGQNNVTSTISHNENDVPNTNNQFGAEYLPPFKQNDKQSQNKPQTNEVTSFQESNRDETAPELIPLKGQNQELSFTAAASLGPVASGPQPAKPLNTFENQPERPNQSNYNSNSQLISNEQSNPNYSQNNGAYAQALPLGSVSKPTAVPETELTTPLETYQTPVSSQGLQFNSQSASSFGSFGSQSSNNPTKPQSGFNNNGGSQQPTGQALAPSFSDSRPQSTTQFGFSSPSPSVFAVTPEPVSNKDKPQYSQNSFATNNQNNNGYYSTQKPSFSQGPDDSYYYNQPSKPFGTPAARPQGSRFPSSPSYQSNGVISNNQQVSLPSSITLPHSTTLNSVAPTSSSNFGQSQGSLSTNYYNGITQASISPFPPASPTTSAQYDMTQSVPIMNQPTIQRQPNRPPLSQQQSAVPSFPSKPLNTFGQGPSTSFTQIQSDQSSLINNGQSSIVQPFPSKPVSTSGQIPQNSFTQNQIELGQTSSTNNKQQLTPEITPEKESIPNQQYQGTIYEYNKPPEVLPAPEQTDSSSSSSDSMNFSSKPQENLVLNSPELKPQFGTQQTQTGQNTFISQSQESTLNQPQFGTQAYKPFASSSTTQTQFDQNNQPIFTQNSIQQNSQDSQNNAQPTKPNVSSFLTTTQFSQNSQGGSVTRPLTIDNQLSTNTQFGQNTQSVFGSQSSPQTSGSQFNAPLNKPFGSTSTHISTQHNAQTSQVQPFKPLETTGSAQGTLPIKPFGTSQANQGFQGYPSSKPQFGTQLTQFTQSSQQTFGIPQISSQPARRPQADTPLKPVTNVPSSLGFESQKPQFGQNTQAYQGSKPTTGSGFGQQTLPNTQFDSTASKPQFGIQTQFGQDQSSSLIKPISSASSQAQFGHNSAQASSSVESQQQFQSTHSYKPFGALNQGSNYQAQNKPQFDQAPQSTQDANSQVQFSVQPFNPFGSSGTQGSHNKPQISQNKPFSAQQGSPCCQGSKDSSIAPLNLGKPSQAFAQTQSQFAGFQGAQGLNVQSVAGKGEEFGGPRQPPSFDTQTGYHY